MSSSSPSHPTFTSAAAYLEYAFQVWSQINADNLKHKDTSSLQSPFEQSRSLLRQSFLEGSKIYTDEQIDEALISASAPVSESEGVNDYLCALLCSTYYALCHNYSIGGFRDIKEIKTHLTRACKYHEPLALALRSENYWFGECGFESDHEKCKLDSFLSYKQTFPDRFSSTSSSSPSPLSVSPITKELITTTQSTKLYDWPAKFLHHCCTYIGTTVYTWCLKEAMTQLKEKNTDSTQKVDETIQIYQQEVDDLTLVTFPSLAREAQEGNSISVDWLAWRYYNGESVPCDKSRGAALFEESALYGLSWAQVWTALKYQDGDGVEKNSDKAIFWFNKAIEQQNEEAKQHLDKLINEKKSKESPQQ